jgi:hypothetical protein
MTRRLLILVFAVAVIAAACGDDASTTTAEPTSTTSVPSTTDPADADTPQGRLDAARQRWADNGPSSYTITIQELCFCPETIWIDTVVDGAVVTHEPAADSDGFYDPGSRTMEGLFDEIQAAIDEGFATFEADYDPVSGAVERYWVDVSEMMADEEHGVVVQLEPTT